MQVGMVWNVGRNGMECRQEWHGDVGRSGMGMQEEEDEEDEEEEEEEEEEEKEEKEEEEEEEEGGLPYETRLCPFLFEL